MRKSLRFVALCGALLAALPFTQVAAQDDAPAVTARVIVKFRQDSALVQKDATTAEVRLTSQASALATRVGMALRAGPSVAERTQVVFASGMTSKDLAARIAAESDVEYAVPDERRRPASAPNDPLYSSGPPVVAASGGPVVGQWYLHAPSGDVQSSINVEPAWDLTLGSTSVVVAMIDTGVRFDHPDLLRVALGGNLLPGYDMVSDVPTANDGDGRDPDPSDPGDWVTQAELSQKNGPFYQCTDSPEDSSWHGTQTSGLIGALTNNGVGMASVGRNVRILPVRVLGKCGGFDSDIIAGMLWAAGLSVPGVPANPNPARVLNMSLGGDGACTSAYADAIASIRATGAVIVVSAGNSSGHALGTPENCLGVIAVTGLRHFGTKVGFSDLGPEVSISAPAGNCVNTDATSPCLYPILTTSNAGLTTPIADGAGGSIYTDSFNVSLGTSFSAPLVSGTIALMLSIQPVLTPDDVLTQLQSTARPFPTTGSVNADGTPVVQCVAPQPIDSPQVDQLECYCTTSTCGAGMVDAGSAVLAASKFTLTPAKVKVTEFYHPQFNHYFITADPGETAILNAGQLPPWVPTGLTFSAWNAPSTNITNVCRFFSTAFAPLSSHFYTNSPLECSLLRSGTVWALEDLTAFYMMPSPAGTCPSGTVPLYRLYNNGQGGAPNHRYTTDPAVRLQMVAKGWIPEGNGANVVFTCVPAN
jgi:serine protease